MITLNAEKQGESITFLSEPDNRAPRVEVEVRLAPGASGPPAHRHLEQREFFHVTSGRMIARVDGEEHVVEEGESLVVEPGQAHTFVNGSESEPLVFQGAVEPALNFQWMLTEFFRSAIRANGSFKEAPILEIAFILHQVRSEYRLAGIPHVMQDILFGSLARLAVFLGRTREIAPIERREQLAGT